MMNDFLGTCSDEKVLDATYHCIFWAQGMNE